MLPVSLCTDVPPPSEKMGGGTSVHRLAACALCLTRVINGKIIEDEVIYNFWQFLVEAFHSSCWSYFNNKLLPSYSKICKKAPGKEELNFSSSFPATSFLLCALLDPIRPDRNSRSDSKVF